MPTRPWWVPALVLTAVVSLALAAAPGAGALAAAPPGGEQEDAPVAVVAVRRNAEGVAVERYRADSPAAGAALASRLARREDVLAAQVDRPIAALADPLRPLQWALDRLEAEQAWAVQDATDVVIAVVDSGVHAAHPDLTDIVVPGWDAFDPEGDGGVDPPTGTHEFGHGTLVAGIAAAVVDNGEGMAGMGRGAKIMPIRVLDNGFAEASDVVKGMQVATERGADIINLSLGGPTTYPVIRAMIDWVTTQGVTVVASGGNSGNKGNPTIYPAAYDGVLAVGATTRSDARAPFSSYGAWIDLVAPGVDLIATATGDGYVQDVQGTSFAAPHIAATAAMVTARYPRATPSEVSWRLTSTATDLGPEGRDDEYGHGLVNPVAALSEHPDAWCRLPGEAAIERTWGPARVETAVAAGCTHWPVAGAPVALVATARAFPDALAGAALAGRQQAPLLLTEPGALSQPVRELLVQLGTTEVLVLGGAAAVSDAVAEDLEQDLGITATRVAGSDRYGTAAEIARRAAPDGAAEVVLATGATFADAVSAGTFQGLAESPPVLLTLPDRLPAVTRDALADLGAESVLVLGGEAVVGEQVLATLRDDLGLRVERLSGSDRYGTSAAALAAAVERADGLVPLLFASGAAFPDALSAGAVAARRGAALVLVPPEDLAAAPAVSEAIGERDWVQGEIIGGEAAVSARVRTQLRGLLE